MHITKQKIVDALSRRITDEDVGREAADALIDTLMLREEWSWVTAAGEIGPTLALREHAEFDSKDITPPVTIVRRILADWQPVEE